MVRGTTATLVGATIVGFAHYGGIAYFPQPTTLSGESPMLDTPIIFTCVQHKAAGCGETSHPRTTLHAADAHPI